MSRKFRYTIRAKVYAASRLLGAARFSPGTSLPQIERLCIWTPQRIDLPARSVLCVGFEGSVETARAAIVNARFGLSAVARSIFRDRCQAALGHHEVRIARSIDTVSLSDHRYRTTSRDPSFLLETSSGCIPAGPTVVSYRWHGDAAARPKLYFDTGEGMAEASSVELAGTFEGWSRTLVDFPRNCRFVRFDVVDEPAEFSIEGLFFCELRYCSDAFIESVLKEIHFLSPQYNLLLRALSDERANGRAYQSWIQRQSLGERCGHAPDGPMISILMPVYDPDPRWLSEAIHSVRSQSYSKWELCIADDCSTNLAAIQICEEAARSGGRIRAVRRAARGHIAAASNSALTMATGEFCALLDHDDVLAPDALSEVAKAITQFPSAAILYSDEDKLVVGAHKAPSASPATALRYDPYFKPDWNPDLAMVQNYVSHLGVYRTSLIRAVGGFREGIEGAQDWDLLLRAAEHVDAEDIRHIPRILYHWRACKGSIALGMGEKPYALAAARRVLEDMVRRRELPATVEGHPEIDGGYRIRFLPPRDAAVTIAIPTRDRAALLAQCIDSIEATSRGMAYRIVVIDNDSKERTTRLLLQDLRQRGVEILSVPGPFNYSAMINQAVRHSNGGTIVTLNNDIIARHDGWLEELVAQASRPDIGVVGARLLYPDGTIQHAGVVLGVGGVATHAYHGMHHSRGGQFDRSRLVQCCSAVTGACMAFRFDVWEAAGGFDEEHLPVMYNDVDFCLRVGALGYRVLYTPFATLDHLESQTLGALEERTPENMKCLRDAAVILERRWKSSLSRDFNYHPELNPEQPNFLLPGGDQLWTNKSAGTFANVS